MWCGFIELGLSGGRWIGRLRECRLACGVRMSGVVELVRAVEDLEAVV